MERLPSQLQLDLMAPSCHSHFLGPPLNSPGFTADVPSLLDIMVQAKRLLRDRLPALSDERWEVISTKDALGWQMERALAH